ncbi:MAG: PEGA domain-containing protein [Patescibacteria group bacterium]
MRKPNKLRLIVFSILLFSIISFVIIRYLILDNSKQQGTIKIISSPIASLFINNNAIDRPTPFEGKLDPGEYTIKLIPQGDATASATWEGKINIYSNSLTYISRELGSSILTSSGEILTSTPMKSKPTVKNTGEISIETDPVGAIIKLDNDEKGVGPLLLSNIPKGSHELTITLPGYFPKTQKINIDAGYRVSATFKLAVDQSQKLIENEATESAEIEELQREIEITETEVGFLRVREEPTVNSDEVGRVDPGDKFLVIDEADGWVKIEFEPNNQGWISSTYVKDTE